MPDGCNRALHTMGRLAAASPLPVLNVADHFRSYPLLTPPRAIDTTKSASVQTGMDSTNTETIREAPSEIFFNPGPV